MAICPRPPQSGAPTLSRTVSPESGSAVGMGVMAHFEMQLVCAERDQHRIVIGIDVDRDGEQFQYFECWASRVGDVPFGDRQKLVAAAVDAVGDRLIAEIQPLPDTHEAIIVPIESHPAGPVQSPTIAAALLDLVALNNGSLQPPTIHTIDLPYR